MTFQVLIPVKRFDAAKSRLSPMLRADQRARLAEVMLRHTLAVLDDFRHTLQVSIVTSDANAAFVAGQFGAKVISDATSNLNDALEFGRQHVQGKSANKSLLVLPADLPALSGRDIRQLLSAVGGAGGTVIVPAHDGDGTNAILLSAGANFGFSFGPGSFQRHVASARAVEIEPRVMTIAGIAADLDHPNDICRISELAPDSLTANLLREFGLLAQSELSEAS